MGAALEESLKTHARAIGLEVGPKDTLTSAITKLKAPDVQVLNEFEAKRLEALAKMRNDAAHGGEFDYQAEQVRQALAEVRSTLDRCFVTLELFNCKLERDPSLRSGLRQQAPSRRLTAAH